MVEKAAVRDMTDGELARLVVEALNGRDSPESYNVVRNEQVRRARGTPRRDIESSLRADLKAAIEAVLIKPDSIGLDGETIGSFVPNTWLGVDDAWYPAFMDRVIDAVLTVVEPDG